MDWIARSDWSLRSPEFGALAIRGDGVGMELVAKLPDRTWELWRQLPVHPNILTADDQRFLRYAALDWNHPPISTVESVRLAILTGTLARTFELVTKYVPLQYLAWLSCPFVKLDLEGVMRIGFGVPQSGALPPELLETWPLCTDRSLVFIIGRAILSVTADDAGPFGEILERCVEPDPADRFASSVELRAALYRAGDHGIDKSTRARVGWDHIERGLGWLAVGQRRQATKCFEDARGTWNSKRALALLDAVRETPPPDPVASVISGMISGTLVTLAEHPAPPMPEHVLRALDLPRWPPRHSLPWAEAGRAAPALEGERNFEAALAIYIRVDRDDADHALLTLAHARCLLGMGDLDAALDKVAPLLDDDSPAVQALEICAFGLIAKRRFADAVVACAVEGRRTERWSRSLPSRQGAVRRETLCRCARRARTCVHHRTNPCRSAALAQRRRSRAVASADRRGNSAAASPQPATASRAPARSVDRGAHR